MHCFTLLGAMALWLPGCVWGQWVEFEMCGQKPKDFFDGPLIITNVPAPNLGRVLLRADRVAYFLEIRSTEDAQKAGIPCTLVGGSGHEVKVIGDYESVRDKVLEAR